MSTCIPTACVILAASIFIFYSLVQNKDTEHAPKKSPEEITKGVKSVIDLLIKKEPAEQINKMITLLAEFLPKLPLPKEDIDVDAIIRELLKDEWRS